MNKKWYLYVLECSDSSLYCGITTDTMRRLDEHNFSKKGAKYTRSRRPSQMVYVSHPLTRSCAASLETRFKKLTRGKKWNVVNGDTNIFDSTKFDYTIDNGGSDCRLCCQKL